MKIKHLRSLMGVLLAGVLALTPAGSAFVPVYGAEAEESVSENTVDTDEDGVEVIDAVNQEKTEDAAGSGSENEAESEAEEAEKSDGVSVSENENAPVTQKEDIEENAGDVTYEEAEWNGYDCILDRANKRLTLIKYTGDPVTSLTVPAKATGITLKQGGSAFSGECTVCIGRPLDYEEYDNQTSIWNKARGTLEELTLESGVECNQDLTNVFWGLENLTSISLNGLDTSNVTDMSSMFSSCTSLTTVDVSGFNTENVTFMDFMFYDCSNLTALDVSGFKTENVTTMNSMFEFCSSLETLVVSGFDTSNVEFMVDMFDNCSALTALDVSGFDTSNVKDMEGMFCGCSNLTALDVSGFDTSNVTEMDDMFLGCSNLTALDVSGFDTSNVTEMGSMFKRCSSLTALSVNGFDTSKVRDMSSMFEDCSALVTLDLSGFDTSGAYSFAGMFKGCPKLESIIGDLSNFSGDSVGLDDHYKDPTDHMIADCGKLKKVDLNGFSSFTGNEFKNCKNLEYAVFPDKLTAVTLTGDTPLQGKFYFPETLTGITFGGHVGNNDLTVYGPLAIKEAVEALNNDPSKGSGTATFKLLTKVSQDYPYQTKIPVKSLTLDKTSAELKYNPYSDKGTRVTLSAQILPSSASNQKVRWSVSDDSIYYVKLLPYDVTAKEATFVATREGEATVIATSGDGKANAECKIKVVETAEVIPDEPGPEEVRVSSVELNTHTAEVAVNNTIKLKATVKPENATNKKVTWKSKNNSVAAVDQEGNVTGKKAGRTTIEVTTEDGEKKDTCLIIVLDVSLIGITLPVSANVEKGKTTNLEVTFNPPNASNKNLTWTVSDPSIATVANGTVTGVSAGSTVVTAKSEDGGHTASCTVTVTEPAPEPTPVPGVTSYTVVFRDGDTVVETQLVQDGQPVKMPDKTPAKEGFSFLGWANGNKLWNFNQPVHFNLTLIAKYVSTSPEAVSKNSGSGSDPVPEIQNDTIYLVKGQTYTAGGSGWSLSEGTGIAKVAAKTGKISAQKKGKAVVTNGTQKYTVIVAEPAFESSAKKIPLLVGTTESVKDRFKINSFDTGSDSKYPITWASANPKIAVVNDGVITGMAKGNVIIYACVGGKQYTSKVTVTDTYKAPAKQTERTISFTMNPLQTITLKYDTNVFKVKGAKWSGDGLEATSNNKGTPDGGFKNDKISITKAGKIKAIGKGSTTITGKDAQNREVQVTITVHAVSSKENTYITKGKRETVKFAFVKNSKAAWDSSDKSIISDFKNGSIKGASVGSSKISCTYEGFEFNTLAYVEDPEFNTDDKLVKNGTKYTMTLNAGELYNRVTMKNVYQTINFKSSKPAVAFIDENGVIYARNAGKTNITTSINGKTIKIALEVK